MTHLLFKLFIKDKDNIKSAGVRHAYGALSGVVGIVINILLAIFKFTAGLLSGSVAITADALNNFSDAGSQVISLISFKMAAKPAAVKEKIAAGKINKFYEDWTSYGLTRIDEWVGKQGTLRALLEDEWRGLAYMPHFTSEGPEIL